MRIDPHITDLPTVVPVEDLGTAAHVEEMVDLMAVTIRHAPPVVVVDPVLFVMVREEDEEGLK